MLVKVGIVEVVSVWRALSFLLRVFVPVKCKSLVFSNGVYSVRKISRLGMFTESAFDLGVEVSTLLIALWTIDFLLLEASVGPSLVRST